MPNDDIDAGAGSDTIYGGPGDDTIYDEQGVNRINDGGGNDTAVFAGNYAACRLTRANGVTTAVGSQGTSTLASVETIRFAMALIILLRGLS